MLKSRIMLSSVVGYGLSVPLSYVFFFFVTAEELPDSLKAMVIPVMVFILILPPGYLQFRVLNQSPKRASVLLTLAVSSILGLLVYSPCFFILMFADSHFSIYGTWDPISAILITLVIGILVGFVASIPPFLYLRRLISNDEDD